MRVPRGGLLLLLFTQPPAPGLHLSLPPKAQFFPSRSIQSVRLGSKSLPDHQLGALSQSGKFAYLFSRGWEHSDVGCVGRLKGKRSVQGLSTSTEAVPKANAEAEERRKKKWVADREAEQAEVQKGKRIWLGEGKLVYSSQKEGGRNESLRQQDDNGSWGGRNGSSDSTAGYQRDGQGTRGRGAEGFRGGRGRGAGRGRGIGRGRGEFQSGTEGDASSSRSLGKRDVFYPEGSRESSTETNAGDTDTKFSRGTFSRGGSSRGGSSRGGYVGGQYNASGSSNGRGRGGPSRGGFGRRGGLSRGAFSRGGSTRGGLGRGAGRGGFTRGDFSRTDKRESDRENGSSSGSPGGFSRGRPAAGGFNRDGYGRGAFSRVESSTNDQTDSGIDNESNSASNGGLSSGMEGPSRGGYRGGFSRDRFTSRGGYGRGNSASLSNTQGSGSFEGGRGNFSRGLSRGRGGFSRGRGGPSRGGFGRDSFSRRDNDDVETDNRRSERFDGGRGVSRGRGSFRGVSRGRGSFGGRDPRPQVRPGSGASLAAGRFRQQEDEPDDSDDELLSTTTFPGGDGVKSETFRTEFLEDSEEDSDNSDREGSEVLSDDVDREDSDALSSKSGEALCQEDSAISTSVDKVKLNMSAESQPLQRELGEEKPKSLNSDVENGVPEYQSEAYKERKVAWLCKEIPFLSPRDIVSILNAQKRWITAVEIKQVIQHLVHIEHSIRAYRVYRWMVDQKWYEFDFALHTQLTNLLCKLETTRRARDLFDQIIDAGKVPDSSTFIALTSRYIEERLAPSIEEAWILFHQMQQLGGYNPPPSLQYALFDALMQKTEGTPVFAERADMLFQKMKETGVERSREMFESLMTYHARKGNSTKVGALSEELIAEGLEVGSNVFSKMVDASAEEGSPEKAEKAFHELLEAGYKADVSVYTSLMMAYGKASRSAEALEKFGAMEAAGIRPNLRAFNTIISIMANAGQQADTEMLLERLESSGRLASVLTYNAVIQMYCKKNLTDEAERVFKQMLAKEAHPDKNTYVALIEHYVEKGLLEDAGAMYEEMRDRVQVTHKAYTLMLLAYGKGDQKDKVKEIFDHPSSRRFSIPDDCKKYLISVVGRREVEERSESKITLQKSQRKALMGLLLGGARVETRDRDRTYEVHFELDPQGPGASDLIDHLYQAFLEWAAAPPGVVTSQADQESEESWTKKGFATVSHGSLRFFSQQFRNEGKPVIPKLIHRWLNPECLAYWYMYGGQRCDETGGIILNVADYSPKDIILVRKAMQQISLDCDVKESGGKRILQLEGQSARWMWKLIEPHVVDKLKDVLRPTCVPETDEVASNLGSTEDSGTDLHEEVGKPSTDSAEDCNPRAEFPRMAEMVQSK